MAADFFGIDEFMARLLYGNLVLNRASLKTSNYTVTIDDCIVPFDTSGGSFTITLPDASTFQTAQYVIIKDEGGSAASNNLTIDTTSNQTINGELTITVNGNYDSLIIYSNGSNWFLT